jgi:hypothetical protein
VSVSRHYRGHQLWQTEIFRPAEPDPRNAVHYDLIVAHGRHLIPETMESGTKTEREAARTQRRPLFEAALIAHGTDTSALNEGDPAIVPAGTGRSRHPGRKP